MLLNCCLFIYPSEEKQKNNIDTLYAQRETGKS